MEVQPSKRTSVLLELGAVGYLIGAVIWVLFWIIMSYGSYRLMVDFLYIGSPLLILSLILTGIGSFAIGKLYDKSVATTLGIVYIIAVVPFIIMGAQQMPFYLFPNVEFLFFHLCCFGQ